MFPFWCEMSGSQLLQWNELTGSHLGTVDPPAWCVAAGWVAAKCVRSARVFIAAFFCFR